MLLNYHRHPFSDGALTVAGSGSAYFVAILSYITFWLSPSTISKRKETLLPYFSIGLARYCHESHYISCSLKITITNLSSGESCRHSVKNSETSAGKMLDLGHLLVQIITLRILSRVTSIRLDISIRTTHHIDG
jgi:hypothetical protein